MLVCLLCRSTVVRRRWGHRAGDAGRRGAGRGAGASLYLWRLMCHGLHQVGVRVRGPRVAMLSPGQAARRGTLRVAARPCAVASPCGRSSMVEPQPSKLVMRVRFPSPALILRSSSRFGGALVAFSTFRASACRYRGRLGPPGRKGAANQRLFFHKALFLHDHGTAAAPGKPHTGAQQTARRGPGVGTAGLSRGWPAI